MQQNRARALTVELTFEGGKVDDPQDAGGRTNQGVTQRVYTAYRRNRGLPDQDVYLMTAAERDDIYGRQYLDAVQFDRLPAGVDLLMADGAVQSGPVQATKWLQRALVPHYAGRIDGAVGEGTLAALAKCNAEQVIHDVCARRMTYLRALKNWSHFRSGWTSRVDQLERTALAWAVGVDHAAPQFVLHGNQKATLHQAKRVPTAIPGSGIGGAGAAVAIATSYAGVVKAQVQAVGDALPPDALLHAHAAVAAVVAYIDHGTALAQAGGALAATLGAAWATYAKWRGARLRDALDLAQPQPAGSQASPA